MTKVTDTRPASSPMSQLQRRVVSKSLTSFAVDALTTLEANSRFLQLAWGNKDLREQAVEEKMSKHTPIYAAAAKRLCHRSAWLVKATSPLTAWAMSHMVSDRLLSEWASANNLQMPQQTAMPSSPGRLAKVRHAFVQRSAWATGIALGVAVGVGLIALGVTAGIEIGAMRVFAKDRHPPCSYRKLERLRNEIKETIKAFKTQWPVCGDLFDDLLKDD